MSAESNSFPRFPSPSPVNNVNSYPPNVGIHALDIYFPKSYIKQSELEKFNNVSAGKYTIGLGQEGLAYVNDREDFYSIALTAVSQFMKKYDISYNDIGRLEVGTETIMDHSKSVKSVLMQLFAASGNTDIEGIDTVNACYGGTAALFSSLDWVESSAWDGRYALVVCGDIAEYAEGPARPTNGQY
jgi:hydroxymethylglutaryl-CoA synthase